MADLLLELFSEEIPARMQGNAAAHLVTALESALKIPLDITSYVAPRRLAIIAKNLPVAQPDINTELKGPKIDAPEAALQGFLKKSGLKLEQLEKRDGVYFASIHQKGKPTADVLKEIIEKILATFPWPKSMRWGAGEVTWVRPLHSILCIFDGKVVPVEFGGVKAGNFTYGHRFLNPEKIVISKPQDYEPALEKAHVIADHGKRRDAILKQAEKVAATQNLVLKKDEALLDEVTGLVEWPVVLMGTIDRNFMDLPWQVLVSEMRTHQKYFALETREGIFPDKFLITANIETKDGGRAIIAGNERVLRARLADGRFFLGSGSSEKTRCMGGRLKKRDFPCKTGNDCR